MGIKEIVLKLEEMEIPDGCVEFINDENRNFAVVSFQDRLENMITGEVERDFGYIVYYSLPEEEFSREFNTDSESYSQMILSIYEAEKRSYRKNSFYELLDLARKEGEQKFVRFPDGAALKIEFGELLQCWMFEYPDGNTFLEDNKHLASNRIGDFYSEIGFEGFIPE